MHSKHVSCRHNAFAGHCAPIVSVKLGSYVTLCGVELILFSACIAQFTFFYYLLHNVQMHTHLYYHKSINCFCHCNEHPLFVQSHSFIQTMQIQKLTWFCDVSIQCSRPVSIIQFKGNDTIKAYNLP